MNPKLYAVKQIIQNLNIDWSNGQDMSLCL